MLSLPLSLPPPALRAPGGVCVNRSGPPSPHFFYSFSLFFPFLFFGLLSPISDLFSCLLSLPSFPFPLPNFLSLPPSQCYLRGGCEREGGCGGDKRQEGGVFVLVCFLVFVFVSLYLAMFSVIVLCICMSFLSVFIFVFVFAFVCFILHVCVFVSVCICFFVIFVFVFLKFSSKFNGLVLASGCNFGNGFELCLWCVFVLV